MDHTPLAPVPISRRVIRVADARRALVGPAPWRLSAAVAASVVLSLLLLVVQRRSLAELFVLSTNGAPGPDAWLYPAALVSTSLVLLAPSLLVAALLLVAKRSRASRSAFLGLTSLSLLLALLDLDLLCSIGRHLAEITALALQPEGHVAGGSIGGWLAVVLWWATAAILSTLLVTRACQVAVAFVCRRLTPLLRAVVGFAGIALVASAIAAPILLLGAWGNHAVVERLYASALLDVRLHRSASDDPALLDPHLGGLFERLRSSYKAAFPALTGSGKPADARPLALPARPPNVVLIVAESFRHDAFGPELMPRLSRWAERGLVSTRHDAGTIYSQSGAFALLYGRSPAVFHQTLDAQVPPQFCVTLRNSGYECDYFTGHPQVWMRREDFLNERTMDHFVHNDRGSWPEWDQRALDNLIERIDASDRPVFATVLLMSSHFDYRYPPQYEIDRPVSNTAWLVTMVSALGPEAELPHRNRYRNCMRFIDDLVANAIGRLDPERNVIILTGDHGESINDDGHYTHGYSFAEILTRTPFAMVGPGIAPARLEVPTSHIDVLPSVLHALSGQRTELAHLHGVDWLAGERNGSELAAHSPPSKQSVETQLRVAGHRLRIDLDLTRPTISLKGFEDELGHPMRTPELSEQELDRIAEAFEEQLSRLRR